jgi:hypothetical protein
MREIEKTRLTLEKFRDYVIQQSRSNLTKGGKNDTKSLYNEIKGDIFVGANSIGVNFSMPIYGQFQDKGVKGSDPSQVSKRKNIRLRDDKGKFKAGSYKTIGIIIAKNVWARGLKPSLFFTTPFEAGYKKYIDTELIEAFALDVESLMESSLKDIK